MRLEFERPTLEHFYDEDYLALTEDMERLGWTVVERPHEEYRSLPPEIVAYGITVSVWLGKKTADAAFEALAEVIKTRLRRPRDPKQPPRRCVIYGPDGETLKEIDLDAEA